MFVNFDDPICTGCGYVGEKPGPPAMSCCPERDTFTLAEIRDFGIYSIIRNSRSLLTRNPPGNEEPAMDNGHSDSPLGRSNGSPVSHTLVKTVPQPKD